MTPNLHAVTRLVADIRGKPLSGPVLDMARRCVVDWIADCVAALAAPEARALNTYAASWHAVSGARSLFGTPLVPALSALVNGAAAHLLGLDDVNADSLFHPGAPTIAAAFATALGQGSSQAELLRALVAGYEVGAAFGTAGIGQALAERGWHPTAVLGHLSAVAASAVLTRLDEDGIGRAFGLAATQAGGLLAAQGSSAKPFQVGKAAMNGVMAAEAALAGLEGPGDLLDEQRPGLFQALIGRTPEIMGLSDATRILQTQFRAERGGAGAPMDWPELRAKFASAARPHFGARTDAVLQSLETFGSEVAVARWFRTVLAEPAVAG